MGLIDEISKVNNQMINKNDIHVWIEGHENCSEHVMWKSFLKELFPDVSVDCKGNSTELVKSVKKLANDILDTTEYIIVFDNAFDNTNAVEEFKKLKQYTNDKINISILSYTCFEYWILSLEYLIDWIFETDDYLKEKRLKYVHLRDAILQYVYDELDYGQFYSMVNTVYGDGKVRNIEQVSAKLLFDITRNTQFEISKSKVGDCWLHDCCDIDKGEDDICGLSHQHLSKFDKMYYLYKYINMYETFKEVGMVYD